MNNDELAELDRLRWLKQREEYEILLKQKSNIAKLKEMQNNVVYEKDEEESEVNTIHENYTKNDLRQTTNFIMNKTIEVYPNQEQDSEINQQKELIIDDVTNNDRNYMAVFGCPNTADNEVRIHESDEDNDSEEDEQDDINNNNQDIDDQNLEDNNTKLQEPKSSDLMFAQRSKSDQIDDMPQSLVVLDIKDSSPDKSSGKKKGKIKIIPKTIKRIFPN